MSTPDPPHPPERSLQGLLRMSQPRVVASITALTTAASVLMTAVMLWLLDVLRSEWASVLLIAAVIPLLLATPVGVVLMRLAHELEDARRLLQAMAIRDGLTGVYNRRHFLEVAELEFARAKRHQLALSVAMLDVDLFKRINDVHGHGGGDTVLRGVCEVASRALRDHDVLARYGGEEFVVLLPQTHQAAAAVVAERVRAAVAVLRVDDEAGRPMAVTVSVGVGTVTPQTVSLNALLRDADIALYQAKANGRDRVELQRGA